MKRFKKGFTLVELLAVIVILGIILVIAVPNILNLVNNSKEQTYESQKKFIIDAAKKYVMLNENLAFENNVAIITLNDLKNANLLSSVIKDPRGGEFADNTAVIITSLSGGDKAYDMATPDELLHKFITNANPVDNSYRYKNGAHRFIGPNPNNWIEFGSIGGTPVMWRIIKKDNEGIQLIYEGLKNGESAPTDNGRIQIAGSWTTKWDTSGSNKWEDASLKTSLATWYNSIDVDDNHIEPINWCIGGSGQGINYPTDYVPTEHFLQTECIDGTYDGGTFKGKTDEVSPVGLIRVSDYISASNHSDCFGSYFSGEGSTKVEYGRRCGREVNEEGRTNYLWKPTYWYWTYTARARNSASVWFVNSCGFVNNSSASNSLGSVRPIINLKSDILYDSGAGTLANPYKVQ